MQTGDRRQDGAHAGRKRAGAVSAASRPAVLRRVWTAIGSDHVSILAAGVAFFGLLALFPAIASAVALAGLVLDPADVAGQIDRLAGALPENAADILRGQLRKVTEGGGAGLGAAALLGLAVSLFSASTGMKTLMEGMTIAYGEEERRGFLTFNAVALALTVLLILGFVLAVAAAGVLPAVFGALGLSGTGRVVIDWGRWPVLALLTMAGLAILYRYGPSRYPPRWRWVSPGAVLATLLWIAGTAAFSIYVRNFGSYTETYGALGGVIVLLTWLWLSAFVVLLGAELNAAAEAHAARDAHGTARTQNPSDARSGKKRTRPDERATRHGGGDAASPARDRRP